MIHLDFYQNKRIGVIGFGKTGKSVADALMTVGALVSVYDDDAKISDSKYQKLNLLDRDIKSLDFLIVSPGISLLWPRQHLSIKLANRYSIPVINDIDLFQQHVSEKNICITGTNGKSTTAALINHILNGSGKRSVVGGNFGIPTLSLERDSDFYILELSSYQLESCNILGFHIAILLNITPDHISRHGGMNGYVYAKQKIFANFHQKSCAIVGVDDVYGNEITALLKSIKHPNVIPISGYKIPEFGIGWAGNKLIDNRFISNEFVCDAHPVLDGSHNRQNIAAAYAACVINGVSKKDFCNGLLSFNGLEHRQELIASIGGIPYINDSKATNVTSAEEALKRFDDILWILGGRCKENGINDLVQYFEKIRFAFLIGEAAQDWSILLTQNGVKNEVSNTLEIAVNRAYETSKKIGKVVLFSPLCSSFDQFKNFEERGKKFKKLVQNLKENVHD
jgi:UDP-N-acetylmuramoylalanine--D-glutamate ligase